MKAILATAILAVIITTGSAAAHERPPYDPDNPESWACQVDPDDPHRHPDEICWDGHDPDDCDPADRTDRGYCPDGPSQSDEQVVEVPELEVVSGPSDVTTEGPASPASEPTPEPQSEPHPESESEQPTCYIPWGSIR